MFKLLPTDVPHGAIYFHCRFLCIPHEVHFDCASVAIVQVRPRTYCCQTSCAIFLSPTYSMRVLPVTPFRFTDSFQVETSIVDLCWCRKFLTKKVAKKKNERLYRRRHERNELSFRRWLSQTTTCMMPKRKGKDM
jgi:hypothetical protein